MTDPTPPTHAAAQPTPYLPGSHAEALAAVRRHYPGALTTDDAVHRLLDLLDDELGIEPRHTLLADSICSDDVNGIEYPERARAMLGPFRLGGLDGFPHAGITGMGAFAGHVPDEGAVVIYHAPHVGVARDGTLGVILREGQHERTGCCGAARAALARLRAGTLVEGAPSELDYQQETIEQLLLREQARILAAPDRLVEATEVMYEAIAARIDLLVGRTRFPARWLVRFGGILVNGDADMGSFSAARRLVITDLRTGEERNALAT
jgi:hypothetical protein